MGAWGTGCFDNDDALDLLTAVAEEGDDGPLIGAFSEVLNADADAYLEVDTCSAAVAAAEVVARLGGVGGDEEQAELDEWVELQDPAVRAVLVDKHRVPAVASVKRVRRGTELAELWAEGDSRAWEAALDDLADRLSRLSKP